MKKFAVMVAAGLLVLTGCSDPGPADGGTGSHRLYEETIVMRDGEVVQCVVYDDSQYEQGGVDCNWRTPVRDLVEDFE